jgi:hypothetical protein
MHLTNLLKNLKFPHPSIEFTEDTYVTQERIVEFVRNRK